MRIIKPLVCALLASPAFAQSGWVTVRSAECGYVAKFPQQPTFHSDAVPEYAGGFRYSEYTIEDDHLVLNVTCSDVPNRMTEAKLDLAKQESAKVCDGDASEQRSTKASTRS